MWRHLVNHIQGRNIGLKSEGYQLPIHTENEAPFGHEAKGEENGEEVSLLIELWDLGERHTLSGVQGPRRKLFLL